MWTLTKYCIGHTQAAHYPAAKIALGVLTVAVALGTVGFAVIAGVFMLVRELIRPIIANFQDPEKRAQMWQEFGSQKHFEHDEAADRLTSRSGFGSYGSYEEEHWGDSSVDD
jgi:hypothetical protein